MRNQLSIWFFPLPVYKIRKADIGSYYFRKFCIPQQMMNRRPYSPPRYRRTRSRSSTPRRIKVERDVSPVINIRENVKRRSNVYVIVETFETCVQVFSRIQAAFMFVASFVIVLRAFGKATYPRQLSSGKERLKGLVNRTTKTLFWKNICNVFLFFLCVFFFIVFTVNLNLCRLVFFERGFGRFVNQRKVGKELGFWSLCLSATRFIKIKFLLE